MSMKKTFLMLFFTLTITFGITSCEISDKQLYYLYHHSKADDFLKQLIRRYIYAKRLQTCLDHFGSKAVCENNTTWFMWAQLLARDIMEGRWNP